MATIIDSLLVTLGLKADDFHKEKKKVQSGLDDLGKSAAKFLAIIGGTYEIKRFIQGQIEANAALDRLSKNLDESANSISAWGNAAELAGGDAKGLQGTMDMLSRSQTEVQLTGQSGLIPYLAALGVSLGNAEGKARPVSEILLDLSDRFGRMNRTTANNVGRMMGIDQGTMNLLLKGRQEVEAYIKKQKEYAAVTDAQAAEASRLRTQIVAVQQSFEAFGRTMLQDVSPVLEAILKGFENFGDWINAHSSLVEAFFTVVATLITAAVIPAVWGMATAMAAAFGPMTLLAAGLAALWDDYQVWKNGGNSLFNWGPAIDITISAFQGLKNILLDVLYRAAHVGAALMALTDGNFSIAKDAMKMAIEGTPPQGTGSDRQNFINSAASQLGVPASAIDAQLRLETGATGASTIGNYNFGNIKAGQGYKGSTKQKAVTEYTAGGGSYTELSNFRSYSSPEEAAADYAAMIKRRFPGAVGAKTAEAFAGGLQAGGYASDPNYVSKVSSIARGIPGASSAAAPAAGFFNTGSQSKNVTVTVGDVHVNAPQAKDAAGIAKDMGKSLDYLFTSQINYGLR